MNPSRLKLQILLSVCLLLLGCKQNGTDKANDIAVIEVVQNLGNYKQLPLSEFVTELEYIPLDTGDDCLIGEWDGGYNHIIVTSSHIFVAGYRFCYAFGRDGRFIGKIGSFGQGPEEYRMIRGLSINDNKQSLHIDAHYSLMEYSYDGIFRQSFKIPQTQVQLHSGYISDYLSKVYFVRNNLFMGYKKNLMGNEKYHFHLMNDLGQVVKSFDNHVQFDRTYVTTGDTEDAMRPYRISENIYVKEHPNDTLYCLNAQNELIPKFVFDLGQYAYGKEIRKDAKWTDPAYFTIQKVIFVPVFQIPMVGAPDFVFFSYEAWNLSGKYSFPEKVILPIPAGIQNVIAIDRKYHSGLYDIINQKTQLLDTDPVSKMIGLINDLDGGLSFWPKYYTSDNELIDIWQAYEMKKYLTNVYFAAHEIKNPQAHQKLKELLKNLDYEDNPVVVIAKLK